MKIWIDADACPGVIKTILFNAAARTSTEMIFVSNHAISIPSSPWITRLQVIAGFDVADDKIMQRIEAGDLVITADVPLAAAVIAKQALALNPRGELYTENNINQRLSIRNFIADVRSSGIKMGGPAVISKREIARFANQLESILSRKK